MAASVPVKGSVPPDEVAVVVAVVAAATVIVAEPVVAPVPPTVMECVPAVVDVGIVNDPEPEPVEFVVTLPSVTGVLCSWTVSVLFPQFPVTDTVMLPPGATAEGETETLTVHPVDPYAPTRGAAPAAPSPSGLMVAAAAKTIAPPNIFCNLKPIESAPFSSIPRTTLLPTLYLNHNHLASSTSYSV
jgi:hypothetical protein